MHDSLASGPQNNGTESASITWIVNALEAFAHAETLDETRGVLEKQQATLLLPDTLATIQLMIDDMFAHKQNAEAKNWRQYLHVLEHALNKGIQEAWHTFITQQSNAVQALEAMTTASTAAGLYQTIMAYQDTLRSDAAFVMLEHTMQRQRAFAPPEAVEYWLQLLDLLEDAQTLGIAAAWAIFEAQEL